MTRRGIFLEELYMKNYLLILFILIAVVFSNVSAACAAEQTISLKQGFNFISFTIVPDLTAPQLKQSNSVIGDIYLFSAAAGSFLSTFDGSLSSLNAGKGYIISANSNASITVSGAAVTTLGNISLKSGFNLVGLSKTVGSLKFSELMKNNSSIKGIYKWSAASGSFISVVKDSIGTIYQIDGVDPVISSSGQSFFINMDSDSLFSYDNGYICFNSAAASDEEAIRNVYAQLVNGIKTKNISSMLSVYSENYLHLNDDKIENKSSMQSMFSSFNYSSGEGTAWDILSMKVSASSARVVAHCKTVMDGAVQEDETLYDVGHCYFIKENGKWLLIGNQKQWVISGFTANFPNNYMVEMYVDDPQHKITSVTMSGPGVTTANSSLIYGFYSWMPARWAPNPMPSFGAVKPSTDSVYNFTIVSNGVTYTETLNLGRDFIDERPSLISPAEGAAVSSQPSFSWSPVSLSGAVYRVEIVDQNYKNIWNGENASSSTSSTYTGTLQPGNYMWCVVTKRSGSENGSFTSYRNFKVL
jgi:hypothetical protein